MNSGILCWNNFPLAEVSPKFGTYGMNPSPHRLSVVSLVRWGQRYSQVVGGSLLLATRRWQMDDGSTMAAAVAYYLALSLFPMLLLLTSGVGMAMRFTRLGHDAEVQILAIVAEHCSPTLKTQVAAILAQLRDQSVVGGPFGLFTAALAAIGVFYQFERAFDKIWRIPPPLRQDWWHMALRVLTERLTAFLLLSSVGVTIVAILAANLAISAVKEWMLQLHLPGTIFVTLLDAVTTMLLNGLAFSVLYRRLPKRPVRWSDALRGGLLVSIIWEVGRQILGVFLVGMRYTTAYGAIGSFIALLLWFYWGVTILLFGAEYVQVLSRRHQKPLTMFCNGSGDSLS